MAMPTLNGQQGTVFGGKNGEIKFDFNQNGQAYALFNIGVQKARKDQYGEWETIAKMTLKAAAYGELAEYVKENVRHLDKIDFTAELTGMDLYENKNGETIASPKVTIRTLGQPYRRENNDGGGSEGY